MSAINANAVRLADVRRRFDRAAKDFGSADFVHRETANGMFQRMLAMSVEPRLVVDLGCAQGLASRRLQKAYKKCSVVCVDVSCGMLQQSKKKKHWFSRQKELCADASNLPLKTGSVDLVFANMLLPWITDAQQCFSEINRVLADNGLFVFSTLGPASFGVLRDAWNAINAEPHINLFADMHNLGDAVVRAGLRDPVVDVDTLTVTYASTRKLFDDLTAAGARNTLAGRRQSLTTKSTFRQLQDQLEERKIANQLQVDLELVYGHAWGSGLPSIPGEYRFDANAIPRR